MFPLPIALLLVLTAGLLAASGPVQVSHSGHGAYEASLATLSDGFAVAWYDTRDGHPEIYARLLNRNGEPSGSEWRLTNGADAAYEPDIAAINDALAIAWYEQQAGSKRQIARIGLWNRKGQVQWTKTLSAPGHNGRNPVVRTAGNRLFCAWLEGEPAETPAVWAGWFDRQGRALSPAQRIAPAGLTTWNLNAAIDARGVAWLVFDAQVGTRADELFVAHIDAAKADVTRLTRDDGFDSKYPDLALTADRVAMTWWDERDGNDEVYLFVAPRADLKEGLESRARRVTRTSGESIGAYLAWNGSRLGLAWNDDTAGQHEVYFQAFNVGGAPLSDAIRLTDNPTWSLIPAIHPWRDTFALVWNEFMPAPGGAHDSDGKSEVVFQLAPKD